MRQQPQCCGNSKCQTTQTPLWRKGWFSHEGKTVMLCNACGLHYKKGHYCMYCHQIYRESDADDYANPWIGCDRCSRWVHQKCEEANGHHWKQQKAYLCPDCRCLTPTSDSTATVTTPTTPTTTTNPGSQMIKGKSNKTSVIKKRRRTPCGSRNESPDSPSVVLPRHRAVQLQNFSPNTPVSPISPGSNFLLFAQQHLDKQQPKQNEPTTPNSAIFDPNINAMPCWNQLQSSIQNLPSIPPAPLSVNTSKKRKIDTTTTTTTKKKKSRTMTTITTTTTHRLNTAGIDALMGAVAEQRKEEVVPHLDLHITTTVRKGKQTSRKMNADARSAAIHASSTDTPTTPTFFAPPLFATTMTTTTTTVVPNADHTAKTTASLTEEQFYQYQQLIMQQQAGPSIHEDGELSNDSSGSSASTCSSVSNTKPPVTILQNTFGSVDKLGNFYGSFNEAEKQPETSPYGMLMDGDEDYEVIAAKRRPQKRTRTSPPKKVTTTTTLTMTTTVSSAPVKSKRIRDRIAKNGGSRVVYTGSSSGTEDSDYEPEPVKISQWEEAAKALNVSLEDAHSVLVNRFPKAPVLKKMGSLWAICEVIRVQEHRSE